MQPEHGQLVRVPRAPPEPPDPFAVCEATAGEATVGEATGGESTGTDADATLGVGVGVGAGDGALSSVGRLPAMHADNRHAAAPICIAHRASIAVTDELYDDRTVDAPSGGI